MKHVNVVILVGLLAVAVVVSACGPAPAPTPVAPSPTPVPPALTEDMLRNGKYEIRDIGAIELKDGSYEKKYGEGATQVNKVGFLRAALGDLNRDGAQDAVVVVWANTGGSGTFVYLVAVANNKGQPQQAAAELLGDRTQLKTLSIENGKIVVTMVTHRPKDPMCCPTQEVTRTYELQESALKMASESVAPQPAPSGLAGSQWVLAALGPAGAENPVLPGTTVTVTLGADGKLNGSAGCNSFAGGYTVDSNKLAVSMLASTMRYCADPKGVSEQENDFLTALQAANTFQIQGAELLLFDASGKQVIRLHSK